MNLRTDWGRSRNQPAANIPIRGFREVVSRRTAARDWGGGDAPGALTDTRKTISNVIPTGAGSKWRAD